MSKSGFPLAALVFLAALGLVGCGGNKEKGINKNQDKPQPEAEQKTLFPSFFEGTFATLGKKRCGLGSKPKDRTFSPGLVSWKRSGAGLG